MSWTAAELASRCGGALAGDAARVVDGVSTDSRTLRAGELFVALRGEHHDGHAFVAEALRRGAAALLVSSDVEAALAPSQRDVARIRVADTLAALGALAQAQRATFDGALVAITGSNGKTTTKEMCFAMLCAAGVCTHRSEGNLNNQIGLPLSLLGLRAEHRAGVFELGMNHPGEIAALARIARPTVGAITQVAPAHLGLLGSLDAIARAKGELLDHLRAEGAAVLFADDPRVMAQAPRFAGRLVRFGVDEPAEVRAEAIALDRSGTSFRLATPLGSTAVRIPLPGRHLVPNALCAAAAALATGLLGREAPAAIARALATFRGVRGRLAVREIPGGALLLDDTYNANPTSVAAALETLAELRGAGRAVAVLGDMLELGPEAGELHAQAGRRVAALGIDALVALGEHAHRAVEAARAAGAHVVREVPDCDAAAAAVRELAGAGDAVLIKGSRGMRMERVVNALLGEARQAREAR